MLPFSTTIVLSLIEYFCVIVLHVIYAFGHFGVEEALWSALGFIPILLTILLFRLVKKESVIDDNPNLTYADLSLKKWQWKFPSQLNLIITICRVIYHFCGKGLQWEAIQ